MSAQLIPFPATAPGAMPAAVASPVPPPVPPATHGRRHYTLADMARLLDWYALRPVTIIRRLRTLVDKEGLPAPLGRRLYKDRLCHGGRAVCAASRWDAAQVDAWLHRPGPTAPPAHLPPPAPPAVHNAMAHRARQLAAGGAPC